MHLLMSWRGSSPPTFSSSSPPFPAVRTKLWLTTWGHHLPFPQHKAATTGQEQVSATQLLLGGRGNSSKSANSQDPLGSAKWSDFWIYKKITPISWQMGGPYGQKRHTNFGKMCWRLQGSYNELEVEGDALGTLNLKPQGSNRRKRVKGLADPQNLALT